jgi:multiple sugar transport system ATP-binding protein
VNLFGAGFIGSPAMNFLKGRVEGGGFRTGDIVLPAPANGQGAGQERVVYGIRPEHWRLSGDGVAAEVVVVEPTGSETQVMVRVGGAPVVCAFRERIAARPGEHIGITPDPALVHLFDEDSGRRLN